MFALGLLACLPFVFQFGASFVCIPTNSPAPLKPSWRWHAAGLIAYWLATILALLRLPFALLPYLAKLLLHALCGFGYKTARNGYLVEALGMLGDISNWVLVSVWSRSSWVHRVPPSSASCSTRRSGPRPFGSTARRVR